MKLFENIVTYSIKESIDLLPKKFRLKAIFLLLGIIVNSFLDLVGLASVLPLVASILQEGFIHSNSTINLIYTTLNFSDEKQFIIFLCCIELFFVLLYFFVNNSQI